MNLITIDGDLCENGCTLEFTSFMKDFFVILATFLIDLLITICIYRQCGRRIDHNDKSELKLWNQHQVEIPIPIQSFIFRINLNNIIFSELYLFPTVEPYIVSTHSIDYCVVPTVKVVQINDEILPLIDPRKLTCYVDGSYSPYMQIGHSGFRASDGSSIVHGYSPWCPRRGSTETEVFAACLAIQYAFENSYNTLFIYTDNSKVEQLLRRPKNNDSNDYPYFSQIFNQYQQQNGNNIIRVERVRGHPTRDEQNQCEINREFAKTDRLVRKKNRQYIRRQRIKYTARFYSYWYDTYYFQLITSNSMRKNKTYRPI